MANRGLIMCTNCRKMYRSVDINWSKFCSTECRRSTIFKNEQYKEYTMFPKWRCAKCKAEQQLDFSPLNNLAKIKGIKCESC